MEAATMSGDQIRDALESSSSESESEQESDDATSCSCKSTCQRKGKCPCKSAGVFCGKSCSCGSRKKPCKNKPTGAEDVCPEITPAGARRGNIVTREQQVSEFVSGLQVGQLQIPVTAAYNNEGGIEMAKALLQGPSQEPHPQESHPQRTSPLSWCICLKCIPMETPEENVCCRRIPCITEMAWFDSVVLNRDVLSLAIRARCDVTGDHATYSPSSFRKAAYRQYVIWKYGYLGRNNRRILLSCVVRCIKRKYPSSDGHYMGFREYRDDELSL